ncbi:peptide-methionine (S)-S-oxide reductase MsrA [Lacticaseibacillus zhaodongensis]|uniref:peptide-methionine (S)-S-oxide reductase MsrA n=1 Tax=Lacticaseibacillus zhaodongensis TaxID=2668065 RepID=UPI0012D2C4E0|nr:peptide-methionine (S)-S-oxide reductase MsrA [Lacticaseibacillus zhaodongensis]
MTTLDQLYALVLNPATRTWEREQLLTAKAKIETGGSVAAALDELIGVLRPLALRDNLTADVADFYMAQTGDPAGEARFDYAAANAPLAPNEERAIFAGGCFWCMVEPFEQRPGIISVVSGYTGGHVEHPTYEQVTGGSTGHVEAVAITFDTTIVSYEELLTLFWQISDPTDDQGQFLDRGPQYRPVIFTSSPTQRAAAIASKQALAASGKYRKPIVTAIMDASTFWPAENYHQQFYQKHPRRYRDMRRSHARYLFWLRLSGKWQRLRHRGDRVRNEIN